MGDHEKAKEIMKSLDTDPETLAAMGVYYHRHKKDSQVAQWFWDVYRYAWGRGSEPMDSSEKIFSFPCQKIKGCVVVLLSFCLMLPSQGHCLAPRSYVQRHGVDLLKQEKFFTKNPLKILSLFFALSEGQAERLTPDQWQGLERVLWRCIFSGSNIREALERDVLLRSLGLNFYRKAENPEVLFLGDPQRPEREYQFLGYERLSTNAVLDVWKIPGMQRKAPLHAPRAKTAFGVVQQVLRDRVITLYPPEDQKAWGRVLDSAEFEQLFAERRLTAGFLIEDSEKAIRQFKEIILTINAMTGLAIMTSDMLDGFLPEAGQGKRKVELINPDSFQCLGAIRDGGTLKFLLREARRQGLPLERMNRAFLQREEFSEKAVQEDVYNIVIPTMSQRRSEELLRLLGALRENARLFHRKIQILVVDDRSGPDEGIRAQVLTYSDPQNRVTVEYLDSADKEVILQSAFPPSVRDALLGTSRRFGDLKIFAMDGGAGNRNFGILHALLMRRDPAQGEILYLIDDDAMPEASIRYGARGHQTEAKIPVDFLSALARPMQNPGTRMTFPLNLGVPDSLAFKQQIAAFRSLEIENSGSETVPQLEKNQFSEPHAYEATTASAVVLDDEQVLPFIGIARIGDSFMSPFWESLSKVVTNRWRETNPVSQVSAALTHEATREGRDYEGHFRQEIFLAIRPIIFDYVDRQIQKIPSDEDHYQSRYKALIRGLENLRSDLDDPNAMADPATEMPSGTGNFRGLVTWFVKSAIPSQNQEMRNKFRWLLDVDPDLPWRMDEPNHRQLLTMMQDDLTFMIGTLQEWSALLGAVADLSAKQPATPKGQTVVGRMIETAL